MLTGTTRTLWMEAMYAMPDGSPVAKWYADDSRFPGVWCDGDTEEEALNGMCEVLRDWWAIKTEHGDDDLPPCVLTYSA